MFNNPFPIFEETNAKQFKQIIVIDFDGTLNKPVDLTARFDWHNEEACNSIMENHAPDWRMISLVNCLFNSLEGQVSFLILTGRPERYRKVSEEWLTRHKVKYNLMIMKPESAIHLSDFHWKTIELKALIEAGYNIWFAIEDRSSVVEAFRKMDILTLQCQEGNY